MTHFHSKNVGRKILLSGVEEQISKILADGKAFRIKSEENGQVVHDFTLAEVSYAECLTVSYDNKEHWQDIVIAPSIEDAKPKVSKEQIASFKAKK